MAQEKQVINPISQRRKHNAELVKAVEKVLSKDPLVYVFFQGDIRGGNYSNVCMKAL